MTRPRVAMVVGLWRRLALTRVWWRATERMRQRFWHHRIRLEVWSGGSESAHKWLALDHGASWMPTENEPLGRKMNRIVERAFSSGVPDYLMVMGQDDFLADGIVDRYAELIRSGVRYAGLRSIWFWDVATGLGCAYQGYPVGHHRHHEPVGAGRLIHRDLITRAPWADDRTRGMDLNMTQRLGLRDAVLIEPEAGVAVDVKTGENLWTIGAMVRRYGREAMVVDPQALHALPEWPQLLALRQAEEDAA